MSLNRLYIVLLLSTRYPSTTSGDIIQEFSYQREPPASEFCTLVLVHVPCTWYNCTPTNGAQCKIKEVERRKYQYFYYNRPSSRFTSHHRPLLEVGNTETRQTQHRKHCL